MNKKIRCFVEAEMEQFHYLGKYIHFNAVAKKNVQYGKFTILKNGEIMYNIRLEKVQLNQFRNVYIGELDKSDNIEFMYTNNHDFTIWSSNTKQYNPKQEEYLTRFKVETDNNITFNKKGSKTPKKIVFAFPGYGAQDRVMTYPFDQYNSVEKEMIEKDVMSIAFLDNYWIEGSWMMYNEDMYIVDEIVRFIKKMRDKYNLKNEDIQFQGVSKGGTLALFYAQYFKGINVFAFPPAMSLDTLFYKNKRYSLFVQTAKIYGCNIEELNVPKILSNIDKENNVHYYYGEIDHYFNENNDEYIRKYHPEIKVHCVEGNKHGGPIIKNLLIDHCLNYSKTKQK